MVRVHMAIITVEVSGSSVLLIQHSPRLTSQAHMTSMTHYLMYLSPVHLVNFFWMCNKPYISSLFIKQLWQSVSLNLYSCYSSDGWLGLMRHPCPSPPAYFIPLQYWWSDVPSVEQNGLKAPSWTPGLLSGECDSMGPRGPHWAVRVQ